MHGLRLFLLLAAMQCAGAAWHQVFIPVDNKSELPRVAEAMGGFDPCGTIITEAGVELPVDDEGMANLVNAGLRPQVIIADLEQHYAERLGVDRNYGAYHTYSEGMAAINQLHADFPSIVGAPFSIGTTLGGNTIWAFKVSDNPGVDENEPEVLFGAYIHAREAITIEVLLHFLTHLTSNYGTDTRVTDIVNGRELWFIPFINPDGVLYNESTNPTGGGMWRKNRRNNGGSYGVDLNRNFGYQWGYDNVGSSPTASDDTYRGPSANSELETQAMRNFVNAHPIVAMQSYHSYSNLMIYPYGYADIHCEEPWHTGYVSMTGQMSAGNGYSCGTAWELLYNTNGDAVDWGHGATTEHSRVMSMTTEVGTSSDGFWPAESRIPALVAENLEPNLLFAEIAGNPWGALPPAAPTMAELGSVGGTYTLSWSTPTPDPNNPATSYELHELTGLSSGTDAFTTAGNWTAGTVGFALSTARSYSAPNSYFGGTGNNRNATSELTGSIQVTAGLSIGLRAWYSIESGYDYAYVEVSTNGTTWTPIAGTITTTSNPYGLNDGNGITGTSSGFVAATFPLTAYVGQSVRVRLRYETDGGVLNEGIYVDDFSPVQAFTSDATVVAGHSTTSYTMINHAAGTYYYRVRATDADNDVSGWSNLITVVSSGGLDSTPPSITHTSLLDTPIAAGPWAVTATISDVSGVASATLAHHVNGGAWVNQAMTLAAGAWSANIPGPVAVGGLVEYTITAVDASTQSNSGTSAIYSFHILPPVGLSYCQNFTSGLSDFTVVEHIPAGNGWVTSSYTGHGTTAYIQYSTSTQEDHASLISPIFDCSAQGTVSLSFWHLLRLGYSGAFTDAYVKGSVDGGATWAYTLAEWHSTNYSVETNVTGINTLDISSWAAGQGQVRVKFEFHDRYDWYWHVDDVCLTGTLAVSPDPVVVSVLMAGTDAQLSWAASPGAAYYKVYASSQADAGYSLLGTTSATTYTHVGAQSVDQQYYQVTAAIGARQSADPQVIPTVDPDANAQPAPPEEKPLH